MANSNSYIASELQTRSFRDKIELTSSGVDFNWRGFDHTADSTKKWNNLELRGVDANVNRVLFWLASKPYDYIRSNTRGGVLYELIGGINNDPNTQLWEESIRTGFNTEFSNDLDLLYLNLKLDKSERSLGITMIVRDKITNRTFPVSTEVFND
mgnify:CR=1 FL=1